MPEKYKFTMNIDDRQNESLTEISSDLMITKTEYHRRLMGLGSILHKLIQESSDGQVRFTVLSETGQLEQRHIVNDLQF